MLLKHQKNPLHEKTRKNITHVLESSHDLLSLINAILDLAKIEAGKMAVVPSEFNIGELVNSAVSQHEVLLKGKDVVIHKIIPNDFPTVFLDMTKMKQIVNNLLSNAIKFTEKGEITISLERRSDHLVFDCTDTGIGIAHEDQKIVFDEFRQIDASTTRKYGGTGLGLAIVKKLVTMMEGSVDLTSELGKGSSFIVIVPLRLEQQLKQAA